ncbi:MAG: hypothetical protein ABR575_00255 [Actinomycetota bacterium]
MTVDRLADLKLIAARETDAGDGFVGTTCRWAVEEIEHLREALSRTGLGLVDRLEQELDQEE